MKGYHIAVVGATGAAGTELLRVLERRNFPVASLRPIGSKRSVGKSVRFREEPIPVQELGDRSFDQIDIAFFSAGGDISRNYVPIACQSDAIAIDKSSAFRMDPHVPLVIPEVNADHIKLIDGQSWRKKSGGYVVTNPNCSAIGLVLALAPLQQRFGLDTVMAVTMQAVSGAGYPGVASLDILGNVIPYIAKEEEKMEEETRKLLGQMNGTKVVSATFAMSAQCNRVAVEDGHTESVSIRLKRKAKPEEMIAVWNSFRAEPQELQLPSAPKNPVVYFGAPDRPQPRFDIDIGAGMTTAVGRLRPCGVLDWKFTVLSHNTIRGAAGAAVLNAELLKAKGYLG